MLVLQSFNIESLAALSDHLGSWWGKMQGDQTWNIHDWQSLLRTRNLLHSKSSCRNKWMCFRNFLPLKMRNLRFMSCKVVDGAAWDNSSDVQSLVKHFTERFGSCFQKETWEMLRRDWSDINLRTHVSVSNILLLVLDWRRDGSETLVKAIVGPSLLEWVVRINSWGSFLLWSRLFSSRLFGNSRFFSLSFH